MFRDKTHNQRYLEILKRWQAKTVPPELMAFFFLIAGSEELYAQVDAIIDFERQQVKSLAPNEPKLLTGNAVSLLTLALTLFDHTVDHGQADPVTILSNLSNDEYELAVNAIHVRFNKIEFVTYQYDPVEDFN